MFTRRISRITKPGIFPKPARIIVWVMIVSVLVVGCKPSQTLSYDVPLDPLPLGTGPEFANAPDIIVIASQDEIVSPAEGVMYPEVVMDVLTNLDYSKSFAVLFLVGQVNPDIKVNAIVRKDDNVTIQLDKYSIGPGNYVVPYYTVPYLLIVIEKTGTWGEDIHFVFKTDQADILAESDHYIP